MMAPQISLFNRFAFAAAGEDILHSGQMRNDPDRDKFEVDVKNLSKSLIVHLCRKRQNPSQTFGVFAGSARRTGPSQNGKHA